MQDATVPKDNQAGDLTWVGVYFWAGSCDLFLIAGRDVCTIMIPFFLLFFSFLPFRAVDSHALGTGTGRTVGACPSVSQRVLEAELGGDSALAVVTMHACGREAGKARPGVDWITFFPLVTVLCDDDLFFFLSGVDSYVVIGSNGSRCMVDGLCWAGATNGRTFATGGKGGLGGCLHGRGVRESEIT